MVSRRQNLLLRTTPRSVLTRQKTLDLLAILGSKYRTGSV
jgi:hypothetical protein